MFVESWRRQWRAQNPFAPLHPCPTFVDDRLEMGPGVVLGRLGGWPGPPFIFAGGRGATLAALRAFAASALAEMACRREACGG